MPFPRRYKARPGARRVSASPMLPFVHFDLPALLQVVIGRNFAGMGVAVSAAFLPASLSLTEPLASVTVNDQAAEIRLHEILNRNDTPREVIEFILGHELLHVVIPPREIYGRVASHPPEFWDKEAQLFPGRSIVWAWLYAALQPCLKRDNKREAMMVRRGWQLKVSRHFPGIEDVRAIAAVDAETMRWI